MFANFLIGLREGLEAALIIAILIAYLVRVDRRDLIGRIWIGVGLAVVISIAFAAALYVTGQELPETAEQVFAGITTIVAVGFITWMIFWMAKHSRELKSHLHGSVDRALNGGVWGLVVIAFVAVLREGLETALFLFAGFQSADGASIAVGGAILGLVVAAVFGVLIYQGALRISLSALFGWTGVLLIIVAAGLLSYGLHEFQEAGLLPGAENIAFDVSATIPPESWYGSVLKGLFSFRPETTWLMVFAWVLYIAVVMTAYVATLRRKTVSSGAAVQAATKRVSA